MKISVLASGSRGNSAFIEEGNTRILIDLGMPYDYIEAKLKELDIEPSTIKAILITHTHSDHISGLSQFYKRYKPAIYIKPNMTRWLSPYLKNIDYHHFEKDITIINDLKISIINTSHDTEDSQGFVINDKLVYITDTGYLHQRYLKLIENKEVYIFESNHDIEMLMNGKYPYYIKQRILGDKGHLSNKMASNYLSQLIGDRTKCIVLAHLSEENNTPELALDTLLSTIDASQVEKIIVASQSDRTELINI